MKFRFINILFLCLIILRVSSQDNDFEILNSYKILVIKPRITLVDHSVLFKEEMEKKMRECGFRDIREIGALNSDIDKCTILVCEYNIFSRKTSRTTEVITELDFFDCNHENVYSTKDRAEYNSFSEKNALQQITKHLSVFINYFYQYKPINKVAAPAQVSAAPGTTTEPTTKPTQVAISGENPAPSNPDTLVTKSRDLVPKDTTTLVISRNYAAQSDTTATLTGKYYALIIGISDYTDESIPDLDNLPIQDATKLAGVLETTYTFEKEDIFLLQNPTRRDIVIALDNLAKKVGNNDNVIIFYAGHGHYEEDNQIGYWLPKDAEVENTANWLYNNQLVDCLKKIKSKHTLLISDACFSGSIFKSRSINLQNAGNALRKKYQLASRKAITSGTLKTVPNVSVFMKYLVDVLAVNSENFFSASQLFQSIEIPVGNNSPTTPQYGVIQNVGDEGGDFIFIKRQN